MTKFFLLLLFTDLSPQGLDPIHNCAALHGGWRLLKWPILLSQNLMSLVERPGVRGGSWVAAWALFCSCFSFVLTSVWSGEVLVWHGRQSWQRHSRSSAGWMGADIAWKCPLYTKTWLRQGAVAADQWRTSDAYGGGLVCLLAGTRLECGLPLHRS